MTHHENEFKFESRNDILRVWTNLDKETHGGVELTFEIIATGSLYTQAWTPETIINVSPLFALDASLVIEIVQKKPKITFNEMRAICSYSIQVGKNEQEVQFILPRQVAKIGHDDSDQVRALNHRVHALEQAYLKAANPSLDMISQFKQVGQTSLPLEYLRISAKFPHLTLKEIIDFAHTLRDAGGCLNVHSGSFAMRHVPTTSGGYIPNCGNDVVVLSYDAKSCGKWHECIQALSICPWSK